MRRPWEAGTVGLLALALLVACDAGDDAAPPPVEQASASAGCRAGGMIEGLAGVRREVQVGQEIRSYLLDVPRGPADTPRALLVAFHGFRAAPERLRRWSGLARMGRRWGTIVAFPEGHDGVELLGMTGRGWDVEVGETRDLAFVTVLLDTLEREWCIDRGREFVAGMSNGAMLASRLGCELNERLAGLALVAGAVPPPACPGARSLPVLLIHGGNDAVVPAAVARRARDWWMQTNACTGETRREAHCEMAQGCQADVTYCETNRGHTWPRPATRRILRFFGLQPRDDPAS